MAAKRATRTSSRPAASHRGPLESRIHVGTSGWTYDDWSGAFYPAEVKGTERLVYYTGQFDTVELNASFYRVPTLPMIEAWNGRLPRGFHLAAKGSRMVTHMKKLVDCEEPLSFFFERVLQIRALRVLLWQLPPSLGKDLDRLERFLTSLPGEVRHAVEFRDASWWSADVADLLSRHRAAFVAVSHPQLPGDVLPTTDFLYVRFHGLGKRLYDYDYTGEELRGWVDRLSAPLRGRALYAYFNNDWNANAPRNALEFRRILAAAAG
ncbi:MAG: DUF72 domain-containing protein [Candidatus Krumholzibacteriia bacterium]